jgi:hypothetical protein
MQAIEFKTHAHDGVIKIPEIYSAWYEKPFKVILLADEQESVQNLAEAFDLLTGLSDDFMADGRQQPPLQTRAEL